MKPKKKIERLKARIKDYEQTLINVAKKGNTKGFKKPGSLNK